MGSRGAETGDGAVVSTTTPMPAPVIAPGAALPLTGIEWAAREIMVLVAGRIAETIGHRPTLEGLVGVHEAGHVVAQFLLAERLAGASIIPWPGHSLGRASTCKPTPEILKKPSYTDEQKSNDYARLANLNLAAVEAATEKLISAHWPLVRRLADALVQRKEISGRRCRQILFKALRKNLRRARALAEKDRRNHHEFQRVLQMAFMRHGRAAVD